MSRGIIENLRELILATLLREAGTNSQGRAFGVKVGDRDSEKYISLLSRDRYY